MAPNALNPETPEWLLLEEELLLVEMIECGRLFPCCFKWSIEHTAIEFLVLAVRRKMIQCMRFPNMWRFDMCRLRQASAASF